MTIPTWSTVFVDNASEVSAAFLNGYVRTQLPKALDGVGGGTYSPSAPLIISGTSGFKISGTGAAARLQYSSRSITRVATSPLYNDISGITATAGAIDVGPSERCYAALDRIPNGAIIDQIKVYHNRVNTGGMPTNRVTVLLVKRSISTGAPTTIATLEDPQTVLADYNAHHAITLTSIAETVDNTDYLYFVQVNGEFGGTTASTVAHVPVCVLTVTDQDEAP